MHRGKSYSDIRMSLYRRFDMMTVRTTFWETIVRYLSPIPIVGKETHLSILTFTIYPDLARLWYECWHKINENDIPIVIVDSCGSLRKDFFPKAKVCRFVNKYHSWKATLFIRRWVLSDYVWLTDDDQFILNSKGITFVEEASRKDIAAISLLPRYSWAFRMDGGKVIRPLGSFCVVFNRRVLESEGLTLGPVHVSNPHRAGATYDSVDWANQRLIELGYEMVIRDDFSWRCGFYSASLGRINALGLSSTELAEMIRHPGNTPEKVWKTLVSSLYSVHIVADLYRSVFGIPPETRSPFTGGQLRDLVLKADSITQETKSDLCSMLDSYDIAGQRVFAHLFGRTGVES